MVTRAAVIASLLTILAACSAESSRRGFAAESASEPAAPAEQTPETAPLPSSTPPPDAGPAEDPPSDCKTSPPSDACGVVPQCGCAKSETCDVVDTKGSVACVPWGKAPMGHPCTATAGCAQGLTCVFGTCHAFCSEPGQPCTTAGTGDCVAVKGASGDAVPNLNVCMVQCALEDASACGGKTNAGIGACLVDDQGATDCERGGTRAENQTCGDSNGECGPGLVCITAQTTSATPGASTCKRWCRAGTTDCGGTTQCRSFATAIKVGSVEYGACP